MWSSVVVIITIRFTPVSFDWTSANGSSVLGRSPYLCLMFTCAVFHGLQVNLVPPVVVSEGREEDRLYQVMSDDETIVGDMPLDGIVILEMPESNAAANLTKQDSYTQLASSMRESKTHPSYSTDRHQDPCSPQSMSSK